MYCELSAVTVSGMNTCTSKVVIHHWKLVSQSQSVYFFHLHDYYFINEINASMDMICKMSIVFITCFFVLADTCILKEMIAPMDWQHCKWSQSDWTCQQTVHLWTDKRPVQTESASVFNKIKILQ